MFFVLIAFLGGNLFAQSNEVEEIITTAFKTEKTLQEVPIAVSVISADEVDKANIVDAFDLMHLLFPLWIQGNINRQKMLLSLLEVSETVLITTVLSHQLLYLLMVFIDQNAESNRYHLPMVERIEVLRGPQSTLFGKNATAGVISIITKKPSFEKFGKISTSFGKLQFKNSKSLLHGTT